ncbi:MAG: 3'-5' exonuclease, partial [Mariprofundales bacterium]|nr:3'-5' exonuclease [Mariprofundales bacterium]
SNLGSICTTETMAKIDVINLDRWVSGYLRQRNYEYQVVYDGTEARKSLWQRALDLAPVHMPLPDAFYREEWQRVVQAQSIVSLDQYKRASRIGRGTRLNRSDRVKVWTVFEEYRNLLTQNKQKEVDDSYRDAAQIMQGESTPSSYLAVVVDEAQDMSTQAFHLIRELVPQGQNDLFIVGDGHQRIYGRNKVVLSQCGINIRGRARKLRLNYRTTEEIRQRAVNLLEGFAVDDLDGGTDDNRGYKSLAHGIAPQIEHFDSSEQQCDFIASYLKAITKENLPLHHICIVARIRSELDAIQTHLIQAGITSEKITGESSGSDNPVTVNLATMHRVKGIEFDEVILASMNEGVVPLAKALDGKGDAVERRQADLEERALVYVAMTRAKKKLIVTSYGQGSPYLTGNQ